MEGRNFIDRRTRESIYKLIKNVKFVQLIKEIPKTKFEKTVDRDDGVFDVEPRLLSLT